MKKQLMEIPLKLIVPDPDQPRSYYDEKKLDDLAQSIKEEGVIQPAEVEELPDGRYLLHHGERRWRAAQKAGLETMPAIVVDALGESARLVRGVVENLHREDLNVIDEAKAFARLIEAGWSRLKIAQHTGRSLPTINSRLKWLELEEEIQGFVVADRLSRDGRAADALLSIRDPMARLKLARQLAARSGGKRINTVLSACGKVRNAITKSQLMADSKEARAKNPDIARSLALALAQDDGVLPPSEKKLEWQTVRQKVKQVCNACSLRDLTKDVEEPAWMMLEKAAGVTCDECGMREYPEVCRECPAVDLLSKLLKVTSK